MNGCHGGIGTAWSCNIPTFNPKDIITCVKIWIENDGKILEKDEQGQVNSLLPKLTPWSRGYKGKITEEPIKHRFVSFGVIEEEKKTKVVTEIPIGMWIDDFRSYLDELLEKKQIKGYKNYSDTVNVKFIINELDEGIVCNLENLKLKKYQSVSNMVLFTKDGLRKFKTVDEIIDYFCDVRMKFYIKRKKYQIDELERLHKITSNKQRFLEEILNEDIKVFKIVEGKHVSREKDELCKQLEERNYEKISTRRKNVEEEGDVEEDVEDDDSSSYNYLLNMHIKSITTEKIEQLRKESKSLKKEIKRLKALTEKEMWLTDIQIFENEYKLWLEDVQKEEGENDTTDSKIKKTKKNSKY